MIVLQSCVRLLLIYSYFVFEHSRRHNFKIKILHIHALDKGDEYYIKINSLVCIFFSNFFQKGYEETK